jgi:DMSO/TMAO reductase YedYZ heme-binding membrane subunit
MLYPSVIAHILSAFIMLFVFVFVLLNIRKFKALDFYKKVILGLLATITVSLHGMSHLGLEDEYDFNPLNII